MGINYDEYRKKIESFFISDLDKLESKLMKKILFIITKQIDLDQTITNASLFCNKTDTHIKFINGAHYFISKLKKLNSNVIGLQEIIDAVERSDIANSEVAIIKENPAKDTFTSIMEIVNSSHISLIIVQFPFSDVLDEEKASEVNMGKTIEQLVMLSLTSCKIPLLILKNNKLIEEGYKRVVMTGTDWIDDYAFNTLIQLSNTLPAKLTLLPFIKESTYKESEIANKIIEITKEEEKFIKEANEWLAKHKLSITIELGNVTKNRYEFLEQLDKVKAKLVALYVQQKTDVVENFLEIVRKAKTNIFIVPELQ